MNSKGSRFTFIFLYSRRRVVEGSLMFPRATEFEGEPIIPRMIYLQRKLTRHVSLQIQLNAVSINYRASCKLLLNFHSVLINLLCKIHVYIANDGPKVYFLLEWRFIIPMEISSAHFHLRCTGFAASHGFQIFLYRVTHQKYPCFTSRQTIVFVPLLKYFKILNICLQTFWHLNHSNVIETLGDDTPT